MELAFTIILIVISVLLTIVTLLQGGKSEGVSGAITGSSKMNIFARQKERGSEVIISRITLGLGIAFFVVALVIKYFC